MRVLALAAVAALIGAGSVYAQTTEQQRDQIQHHEAQADLLQRDVHHHQAVHHQEAKRLLARDQRHHRAGVLHHQKAVVAMHKRQDIQRDRRADQQQEHH